MGNLDFFTPTGDYTSFNGFTKKQVIQLLQKYGSPHNLQDSQNDSPSVMEMLDLATEYKNITYNGYVITNRDDFRVSIEGFHVSGLTADETLELLAQYRYADEAGYEKLKDGTYSFGTWWD